MSNFVFYELLKATYLPAAGEDKEIIFVQKEINFKVQNNLLYFIVDGTTIKKRANHQIIGIEITGDGNGKFTEKESEQRTESK